MSGVGTTFINICFFFVSLQAHLVAHDMILTALLLLLKCWATIGCGYKLCTKICQSWQAELAVTVLKYGGHKACFLSPSHDVEVRFQSLDCQLFITNASQQVRHQVHQVGAMYTCLSRLVAICPCPHLKSVG